MTTVLDFRVAKLDTQSWTSERRIEWISRSPQTGATWFLLSFSAALVDDAGDGLVLSSIHARGESRTYAKGIVAGSSEITLTPEEQQALAAARTDRADA